MQRSVIHYVCLGLIGLALSGCASTSVIKNYPAQAKDFRTQLEEGQFNKAYDCLSKKVEAADKILYLQERGRVASFQRNYRASIGDWERAYTTVEKNRMEATVSAKELAAQAAAAAVNDNAIPYKGYSYELVYLHTFQAFNYLALSDMTGALVELRRAQNEQSYALEEHNKDIAKAKEDVRKNKISRDTFEESLEKGYKEMAEATGKVKSSFQNAYTYTLFALLQEISGDLENAYIAYKQALELAPENDYVRENVLRLATKLRRIDDLETFKKVLGSALGFTDKKRDQGRLVVFYEDGWVPQKEQLKIPALFNGRSYTVAMPYYNAPWQAGAPLSIKAPKRWLGKTEVLCHTYALASKALSEDYPKIFIRQLLRLLAKDRMQKTAEKQDNALLSLMATATAILSENADRRSWLTLPNNVQCADFYLPEGTYDLEFQALRSDSETRSITIDEDKTTIVRVIRLGNELWIDVLPEPTLN